ncbi:MAG: amidohydrolase family protein [Pseudomonadota bacterium]
MALLSLFAVASVAVLSACANSKPVADLAIINGVVFVGDGAPGYTADVVITGDRIVAVGRSARHGYRIRETIDAVGRTVSSGFIDPHTHALSALNYLEAPQPLEHYLRQGVTTLVIGNDGGGPPTIAERRSHLRRLKMGPNVAQFVGHNALRERVIGLDNRAPTPSELSEMTALAEQAMQEGALGLSTGLYYPPGVYATTDEVVALARVAAQYDGLYESHLRDESSYSVGLLAAVDEALEVGRRSGARVHIAHIKALGVDVWGYSERVIDRIETARAAGQVVTADQYPWRASGTRLGNALLPGWSRAGGRGALLQRLEAPELLARIREEMGDNLRRRGGADAILLTSGSFAGQTLASVATARAEPALATALALIRDGETRIASFNMHEDDIRQFMRQPWVVTSSDGTRGHPRLFASFPQKFAAYVQEQNVLTMPEFIQRSSATTADLLKLCDRGRLRVGAFADVIVFDLASFAPQADFETPDRLSVGVQHVIINGEVVMRDAKLKQAGAGRALSRGQCDSEPAGVRQ